AKEGEPGWHEGPDFMRMMRKRGEASYTEALALEAQWNEALRQHNERMRGVNSKLGLAFGRKGQEISYDIGNPGDNMANVFVRVDEHGHVLEIKIADI